MDKTSLGMEFKEFSTKKTLSSELVGRISSIIHQSIVAHGDARILLSGGSTPKFVYELLAIESIDWSKVYVGLVDERYVASDSEYSNERLLFTCFERADQFHVIPMVYSVEDEQQNLIEASEAYSLFMERTDYVLLGMGDDGHTASLFPSDEASEISLTNNQIDLVSTKAPAFPFQRISCSKEMIVQSSFVDLLIVGENKHVVLNGKESHLPIFTIIDQANQLIVFYTSDKS